MRRNRKNINADGLHSLSVNHRVGGDVNRLSHDDLNRLLDAAIQILETIGLGDVEPEISHKMYKAGAQISGGRITISRSLIQETLDQMPKCVLLAG